MVGADAHGAAMVLATLDERSEFGADAVEFLVILRVAVVTHLEFFLIDEVAWVDADFIDPLDGFEGGIRFEVDIGDEWDVAVGGANVAGDMFEVGGVDFGLGGEANDFAAGLGEGEDFGDAGVGISGVRGDHRLHPDGVVGAEADVTHPHFAGRAAGVAKEVGAVGQLVGVGHLRQSVAEKWHGGNGGGSRMHDFVVERGFTGNLQTGGRSGDRKQWSGFADECTILAMIDTTLLVIEDDPAVRRGIVDVLEYAGYQVLEAADGHAGMKLALSANYRLLLLDLVMPGPSGFEILDALKRRRPGQAVIILSARGEENDRVRGLVSGADDYVVKPFSMKELLARVDAVLRRTCERAAPSDERALPGGRVDFRTGQLVFDDGRMEDLSERESGLLRYLMDSGGRIVTREEILRQLWGLDPDRTETRTIDMHIMHLRAKLGDKGQEILTTVRGKGYQFLTKSNQ